MIESADVPTDVRLFGQLNTEDQQALIKQMSMADLNRYAWQANKTTKAAFPSLSENTKNFVDLVTQGKIKPAVWKKNVNTSL